MSEGCEGSLGQGQEVIDLVRSKDFSHQKMDNSLEINYECGEKFLMETFETKCPKCGIVYGGAPCHSDSVENIKSAGKDY